MKTIAEKNKQAIELLSNWMADNEYNEAEVMSGLRESIMDFFRLQSPPSYNTNPTPSPSKTFTLAEVERILEEVLHDYSSYSWDTFNKIYWQSKLKELKK